MRKSEEAPAATEIMTIKSVDSATTSYGLLSGLVSVCGSTMGSDSESSSSLSSVFYSISISDCSEISELISSGSD